MYTVIAFVLAASLPQAAPPQRAADDPADYVKQARRLATNGSQDEAKPQVMNALAVSYAFEGNAKEAASFYQKVFDGQVAESNFVAAAATANALGRVYLETGDVVNARRWYQTGYESARRQPDVSADQLAIWEFRWLHAQARISARAGQVDDSRKQVSAGNADSARDTWALVLKANGHSLQNAFARPMAMQKTR